MAPIPGRIHSSSLLPHRPGVKASRSLDRLLAAAGLDPARGVQVVSSRRLASIAFDPSLPVVLLAEPAEAEQVAVLAGRHARKGPCEVLAALYPPGHLLRPLPEGAPRPVDETNTVRDDVDVLARRT